MAKYSKTNKPSKETEQEALKIALGIQKPGQSKEQTKLIAQGIRKGIDLYKKQQKAKSREQDKQRKKAAQQKPTTDAQDMPVPGDMQVKQHWLPWLLLLLSWIGFGLFWFLSK